MATVTGLTKERMEAIEAASIVDAHLDVDDLVLVRFDETEVNVGSVRGATGSPGVTEPELEAFLGGVVPVGAIIDYIGTVSPSVAWLTMVGQTIVDGETEYPLLWAVIPASMKSGSDIVMVDTRKRVTVGYDVSDNDFNEIGKTGGAKTHTLITSEMPSHTHIQDAHTHIQNSHNHIQDSHNHTQNGHNHTQDAHNHTQDAHNHTQNSHYHSVSFSLGYPVAASGAGQFTVSSSDTNTGSKTATNQAATATNQAQTATNQATTATNIAATATNQAATAVNQSTTATNQNTGGGGAHNNMPPFITFLKIIKAA